MKFTVLTLFPEMFQGFLADSILARAQNQGLIEIELVNIRDYSEDKSKRVDDHPYGGGAGMVISCPPLFSALEALTQNRLRPYRIVYLSPRGRRWTQFRAEKVAQKDWDLILICGHYEGIDQRVIDYWVDQEVSIGDYVLTGGELGAAVLIDSISRLLPGVLGKDESSAEESFSKSLDRKREYPHYTRPADFRGMKVPEILLSGHDANIQKWRKENLT
ncbi:MAG TPA: tRNA (guanosine(37)-N1)-methyltransferase TrmD [Candidatus Gracilibacteria bacterium]|nr:tRNA (guanosine(37)-N1)-methyltransferase TrmD [Candidatus Gracilibacteria bacterium]